MRLVLIVALCLLLLVPVAAQTDQCALTISVSPTPPIPFGQPTTVTVNRNFPAQSTVTAPVSLDGQQFCTYANPFIDPQDNTCPAAGTVFNNLSIGDHAVTWTCTVLNDPFAGPPVSGSQPFTIGPPPPEEGSVNPKYLILSVIYAPPGSKSSVDYGNSTVMGNSLDIKQSVASNTTISGSISFGPKDIPDNPQSQLTAKGSGSHSFTQTKLNESTIAVNKTTSSDVIVKGPANSAQGINHDYDIILLWINPRIDLTIAQISSTQYTTQWNGFTFDPSDPANEVDVVPVYVGWLKNPSTMPAGVAAALARTWALPSVDGSGTGLTQADFNLILSKDPFANGSTAVDPLRFTLTGQTFSYAPPPAGGQPATEKFSLAYQTIDSTDTTTSDETKYTFSINGTATFLGLVTATFSDSHFTDFIHSTEQITSQTQNQTSTLTLTGPTTGYLGPTDLQVYQDKVYGTFMFSFVPETQPSFSLAATPVSELGVPGGSATYTVSASAFNGFNSSINLSASGMPAGCGPVTFNPATITGGTGSSTLTVPACSTPGNFTISITGTGGGVTDTTNVHLTVSSAPFLLLASPGVQSVNQGDSATYTVSSLLSPGFAGPINLSISGLPSGATGTFNPISISGADTSILTVATAANTPTGVDAPIVTGSNGASQATTKFDLVVSMAGGQTGPGCSVTVGVNPLGPVEGTPVTYTATVTTVANNNTSSSVLLDGQSLCSASGGATSSCSVTQNAPPTGTHALQWSCTTSGPAGSGTGAGTQTFGVAQAGVSESGSIKPKFAVLSVIYAPPGQNSFVDYGASTALGTTSSIDNSFKKETTTSVTLGGGFSIPKILSVGVSVTKSKVFTQTTDTVSSISVKKTDTFDVKVPGPANGADGINHDFDVILVWLNPVVQFTMTGNNTAQWNGFGFDGNDPANEVDVVPLYVSWLKNPSTMPPDVAAALARSWADPNIDGSGPGLTNDDFQEILQRDPFTDPAYVLSLAPGALTSDDKRFDLQIGETMSYEPPPANGQPFTEIFGLNYQQTQTEGLKATDEFQIGFSTEFSADVNIPITTWLTLNLNAKTSSGTTFDWKNVATQSATQANTQSATVSLTGPLPGYTGPTDVQVFKDNVYGTFMFAFNPFSSTPNFILWTPTDSQTVASGGVATYPISTLSLSGFTGNVALSLSGAPAGITGSFSPASISGTAFSTLTVDVDSSVAAGTYPLTITGTGPGGLTDTTVINVVVAPADFEMAGAPDSQTTTPGLSTTYTISAVPIAGFPGTINLSASGLPTGASASFSPVSISGTGSSTLTVNVASGTLPGSYPLIITGASGSNAKSESVMLNVSAAPFFLTPLPSARDIVAGETTTYTVSSTPLGGFSGPVTLTVSGLPAGATASVTPGSIAGSDFFTVSVTTTFQTTQVGRYPLTFTGTGNGQQTTATADLLISQPFQTDFCAVDISFNPDVPADGQPVTITANVVVPSGVTAGAGIAVDHQQFCGASETTPCIQSTGVLSAGLHTVDWSCTTGSGGKGFGSRVLGVGTTASINPKYQVLSVIYAPPGQNSNVDYGTSTVLGSSVSFAETFSRSTSQGATLNGELDYKIPSKIETDCPEGSPADKTCFLNNIFQFKGSATSTEKFSQALEADLSMAVSKTQKSDIQVPGPKIPSAGINHDYDVILLWINPAANLIITGPSSLLWNGFTFDPNDPVNEVDVVPVYVAWLKDPTLMPPGVRQSLSREWADDPSDGSGRGLTTQDFANILQRDPFANGSTDVDPARFALTGETFAYAAPPNGGQPITETLGVSYQVGTQETETTTDTLSVGYTVKSADLPFTKQFLKNNLTLAPFTVSSSNDKTIALTFSDKRQSNETATQSATLTLAGPAAGYTGPTDLQVYRDSLYGTFMFAFVQSTTFSVSTSSPSQTTSAGGNITYPVSLTSFAGFTGPVVFSTKGLPLGTSGSFAPSSVAADGTTTLTITTTGSVTPGVYPFSIMGSATTATGHETHIASATLYVVPPGGFLLSVSPALQTIQSGDSTSYEITVHAVPGFSSTVNLSAGNFAMADTASFSPSSITGIGSSTMTAVTSTDAPIGSFIIPITGTASGLPQATTQASLVVTEIPASTGIGCDIAATVDPPAPVPGQLVTYTATALGLAAGDSASITLNLDHQSVCTGTNSCFAVQNPPPNGIHVLEWSCTRTGVSGNGTSSGTQPFTVGPVTPSGSFNPKYVVLSVIYTPPGQKSTVDYGTSTQIGSSTSITDSFQVNLSAITKVGPPLPKKIDPENTADTTTTTRSLTQKSDSNRQITISKSSTFDIQVPGLDNPTDGINHDYDIILLWLNPVIDFTLDGVTTGQIPGYSFDPNDPANEADVVPVYVKWLKNPSLMPPGTADALARRWAKPNRDGAGPGLTTDDFTQILKRDPFANGATTIDSTRFDLQAGETFAYEPPPNGGQPLTEKFVLQYLTTSTLGQTATDEYEVDFSVEAGANFDGVDGFLNHNLNASGKLTWTHKVQTQTSDALGQTAALSLTGPCFGYVGPTDVQVYKDNIYGTFMFAFVNPPNTPDFSMCMTPQSLTINTGANDKFTISSSPINGFNSDVALSISGLPAGVTFSVNPIVGGAGSSDMTLNVAPTTVAGSYPLVITGTGEGITHTMNVTLTVKAVPVFALSATPATQAVSVGASTTYTVSSTALNGLTGDVTLSVTAGLPAGATANFSPATITGSTGTSTLTINTLASTPVGTFTLTIQGVNGAVQQKTSITLNTVDFTLAAAPTTQQVVVGASTTYTVTSTALEGLTGDVALSVSGMPTGATARFSPATITGSTGTSTLTVTTTGTTPAANSTLTITGTNGTLTHSASVTLNAADYTISIAPSTQTITAGGSTMYTLTVTGINSFSGTVTPAVTGLPSGATVSFSPATITGSGSSSMTVTTTAATPGVSSTLTVTGSTGAVSRNQTATLSVRNFTLTATPATQQVVIGGRTTYTITSSALNGLTGDVALSVSGLPTGATASFSPATITGSTGTSTLTVTTSGTTPAANSTLTITGTNGTLAHTAAVTLSVTDFSLAVAPSSQTVAAGGSTTYTVTTSAINGFSGTVTPAVSGLPTGASASFSPDTITGSGTSTITVTTTTATPGATSTLTVTGTSVPRAKSATATLVVQTFTIAVSPSTQSVTASGSTSYTVTVTPLNGFTGAVTPSVSVLPTGATASFSPTTITGGSGTSTMTIATSAVTPGANSTLTVTGTSGTATSSATATLSVRNFTLTATPATQQVVIGGSTTYTITSSALNGLTGDVALSVSGLPTGATASFSPATITGSTGTSTLTVTTSGTTPAANSTLTITGTNGTLVHTAAGTLSVTDFSVTVTPATRTVVAGGSTTYTVTTTAINGFSGTVTPAVSGLPTGASASFSPTTIAGSSTSTMTVTTGSSTPAANSTLTVIGTSGPRSKSAVGVTLTVTDFSISVSPSSQSVTAGSGTSYTVTVTALNGFTGSVPLSVSGLPSGVTASFSPTSITGSGTSTVTVSTASSTAGGTSTLTVTGNSGGTPSHPTTMSLTVVRPLVILRPTVDTGTGDFGYLNPANAQDGNAGTFASGQPDGVQGRTGEIWSGFASGPSPRTVVNLKITSAGNCVQAFAEGFALDYSLNGGSTWTTLYSMGVYGGSCANLPQRTDVVSIDPAQNLTQIQVRARFASFGNTTHQVYDAWIEAQ